MVYIPKSKISIKETSGGEFLLNGKNYIGFYIETSGGKYYAGKDPLDLNRELIIPEQSLDNFGTSVDFKKHKSLNSSVYNKLKKYKQVPTFKSIPKEKDYSRGYYTRYFAKRINSKFGYFEINKKTYNSINTQKEEYDYNLYEVGTIVWSLSGNTRKTNNLQLQLSERPFPGISTLFPLLNEYDRPSIIENQIAEKGELVYRDNINRDYEGPYHIHPVQGPMVGAQHSEEPHALLIFISDLPFNATNSEVKPNDDLTYEDYLEQVKKENQSQTVIRNGQRVSLRKPRSLNRRGY